ncbi:MAG: hypothetical protein MK010_01140 [Erythrobacter sp.]|nr:hypothetical protein [Erythrobacter sp.]
MQDDIGVATFRFDHGPDTMNQGGSKEAARRQRARRQSRIKKFAKIAVAAGGILVAGFAGFLLIE